MRRRLLLLGLLAAGCEEMRAAPVALPLPPDLAPAVGDPARAVIVDAELAFRNQAAALQGRPAEAARAAARLEWLAADIPASPRWAAAAPTLGFPLRGARDELRRAIGTDPAAPAERVVPALAAAGRALQRDDRAAAEAALPVALFPRGGAAALERLAAIGPLPAATDATALLAQEARRLDTEQAWRRPEASQTNLGVRTTDGLGRGW